MHRTTRVAAPALLGFALLAVAAVTPAQATELAAKSWEVGGDLVSTTYDNDSGFADTFSFAVRGAYVLQPKHEFEFHVNIQSADAEDKDSDVTYDIQRISLNYIGNFKVKKPDSKFAPYALFGIGIMNYDNGDDSAGSTLFRGGGGVRYFFTKSLALRIEGTLAHFHGDEEVIPRRGYFDFDFAVGVSWVFGGA
ncbi:MAG TPA: acyloxyacyl hydrolase [Candidatus Polarisedimenticolia bacterium]|nr:acyloxyacyl hydrolase [Candidatus Polarisedimenticolia bacterium]